MLRRTAAGGAGDGRGGGGEPGGERCETDASVVVRRRFRARPRRGRTWSASMDRAVVTGDQWVPKFVGSGPRPAGAQTLARVRRTGAPRQVMAAPDRARAPRQPNHDRPERSSHPSLKPIGPQGPARPTAVLGELGLARPPGEFPGQGSFAPCCHHQRQRVVNPGRPFHPPGRPASRRLAVHRPPAPKRGATR